MKCIVVDLEMNQPSGNIIQIGAVLVDVRSRQILSRFDAYCKLPPGEILSEFIVNLTGITSDDLLDADSYGVVLGAFWDYVLDSGAKMISAWGSDVLQLKSDARQLGFEPLPRKIRELDIKSAFQVIKCALPSKSRGGLGSTLSLLEIEFTGRPHNAYWDAYNTAKLLIYMRELQYMWGLQNNLKMKSLDAENLNE